MRLRDLPHTGPDQVSLFFEVSDLLLTNLSSAIASVAAEPWASGLRTEWPSHGLRTKQLALQDLPRLAEESVVTLVPGLSDDELISTARKSGYVGLPIRAFVSGRRLAVMLPHGVFDGVNGIEVLQAVVARAVGAETVVDASAPAKWPTLRALRTVKRRDVELYLARRRERNHARAVTDAELAAPRDGARYVGFTLDADTVKAIVAAREADESAGRASKNTRICSVSLAALAAIQRGTTDLTVEIPLDLRRYAKGGRIDGNFLVADPLGTLRGSDWSASAISGRIGAIAATGVPVLSMVVSSLGPVRARLRRLVHPSTPAGRGHYNVTVPILNRRGDFPDAAWYGEDRRFGCATIGPWPSSTLIFQSTLGKTVRVSVSDDSGLFDLSRFEDEFHAEVRRRSLAVSIGGEKA